MIDFQLTDEQEQMRQLAKRFLDSGGFAASARNDGATLRAKLHR